MNVCLLSINIAAAAGYSESQVVEIGMAALLHDIGMTLIPESIRYKSGALNEDEHFEVHKHPVMGLHLLQKVSSIPDSVSFVAYQHHEREDGKGYPKARKGRFLHSYARIVMIADVFEALSSPRAFRPAHIPYKAMENMLTFARQGLFDRDFIKALINYASLFPVGSLVRLSTQEVAKVVEASHGHHTKPVVSIITDAKGSLLPGEKTRQVDLSKETNVKIIQALGNAAVKTEIMTGF